MKIVIKGRPATKKNSQRLILVKGRMIPIPSKPYAAWEKDALKQITGSYRFCIDYPVNVCVQVWPWRDGRADLVGYIQAALDMLVKAKVLADDSAWKPRIVVGHDGSAIVGIDKKNPRVEITITLKPEL